MNMHRRPANDSFADVAVPQEPGLFTWDLESNTVFADSAMAMLFGLDCRKTECGLPIEDFLLRIHNKDRPEIAKHIRDSIVTGLPYQTEYRVANAEGEYGHVSAFGRCFRDSSGNPSHFAGIVFATQNVQGEAPTTLIWHCLSAYELARAENNHVVAKLLLMALQDLKLRG